MKYPLQNVSNSTSAGPGEWTYRENGSWNVLWKWFNGPWPFPNPAAVEMAGWMYRQAKCTAVGTSMPLERFDAMAARQRAGWVSMYKHNFVGREATTRRVITYKPGCSPCHGYS